MGFLPFRLSKLSRFPLFPAPGHLRKTNPIPIPTTHTPLPSYQTSHPQHTPSSPSLFCSYRAVHSFSVPFSTVFFLCFHSLHYCALTSLTCRHPPAAVVNTLITTTAQRPSRVTETTATRNSNRRTNNSLFHRHRNLHDPDLRLYCLSTQCLCSTVVINSKGVDPEGQLRTNTIKEKSDFPLTRKEQLESIKRHSSFILL